MLASSPLLLFDPLVPADCLQMAELGLSELGVPVCPEAAVIADAMAAPVNSPDQRTHVLVVRVVSRIILEGASAGEKVELAGEPILFTDVHDEVVRIQG